MTSLMVVALLVGAGLVALFIGGLFSNAKRSQNGNNQSDGGDGGVLFYGAPLGPGQNGNGHHHSHGGHHDGGHAGDGGSDGGGDGGGGGD